MTVTYFSENDVQELLDMKSAIDAMTGAFEALALGQADNVPRVRAMGDGIVLHSMCAAADYLNLVGWKQYTTTRQGAKFLVGLYDQQSGDLIALIEADRLGQLRTGAVTGLAIRLLADQQADSIGIFGTGWQARSQLEAAATVLPELSRVVCYSRDEARRSQFAEQMSERLQLPVVAVDQPRDAACDLPVVITATSSRTPVVQGDWFDPQACVCAVGSNWLKKAELDVLTIRRAGRIVCDSIRCCQLEAGDFVPALAEGALDWSAVVELASLVADSLVADNLVADNRSSNQNVSSNRGVSGIQLFKSVGMAIEDVALGAQLLRAAQSRGAGRQMDVSN